MTEDLIIEIIFGAFFLGASIWVVSSAVIDILRMRRKERAEKSND